MHPLLSSLVSSLGKWKEGTRLRILKTAGSLLAFLVCVYLIFQFARVTTKDTCLQLRKYQRYEDTENRAKADTLSIYIYNFYNRTSNILRMDGGTRVYLSVNEEPTALRYDEATDVAIDSLLGCWQDTLLQGMSMGNWRDSLYVLYDLNISVKLTPRSPFEASNENEDSLVTYGAWRFNNCCSVVKYDLTPQDGHNSVKCRLLTGIVRGDGKYVSGHGLMDGTAYEDLDYLYFLREGDLSQSYYTLRFPHEPKDSAAYNDITKLSIDLGGPTRFVGLNPAPDETTLTGFIYTDPAKLRKIFSKDEFVFFCQYVEASNIQSVRTFLVSTIATFFFGLFLRLLFGLVCSLRPKPWSQKFKRCLSTAFKRVKRWIRMTKNS